MVFNNKSAVAFKEIEEKLKKSFSAFREEMDEHLDSINENTREIEGIYKYIFGFEEKLEKLSERIDNLNMQFSQQNAYDDFKLKSRLSIREQEVFLVLYTHAVEDGLLSYREIARKLGLTENLVRERITGLISKGVPVVKKYIDNKTFLDIDPMFKQAQAKNNLLGMNENLTRELVD